MSLKTCDFTIVQLSKLDNKDINAILEENGFDLDYQYYTHTVGGSIHFEQWLDKGSRLSLQNPHIDFHALAHHMEATGLSCA